MREHRRSAVSPAVAPDRRHLGYAWAALSVTLSVHIIDEANHDFLGVYDVHSVAVREWVPFLPWPTFGWWLAGLGTMLLALLALSPWAFRASRWMRQVALVVALLAALNAYVHITEALRFNHAAPGTWSAMLLLLTAAMLFVAARRATPNHHRPFEPRNPG